MEIFQIDEKGQLFISPDIDDWQAIAAKNINVIFDLDGGIDLNVPNATSSFLYIYFPFEDSRQLPDLKKLHELAKLGARLIENDCRVLSHCGMGHNRSALLAGVILTYLGITGEDAVALLRQKRQGALYNKEFAAYLKSLPKVEKLDNILAFVNNPVAAEKPSEVA